MGLTIFPDAEDRGLTSLGVAETRISQHNSSHWEPGEKMGEAAKWWHLVRQPMKYSLCEDLLSSLQTDPTFSVL